VIPVTIQTVPPTSAEVDAWYAAGWANNNLSTFISNVLGSGPGPFAGKWWVYGYTNAAAVQIYGLLTADPTSDPASSLLLRELAAVYGTVTVREYACMFAPPVVAPAADAEQARVGTAANWAPVP
jgi:hypothetical protein